MDEPRKIPTVPYEDAPLWAPGNEEPSRSPKEQREHDAAVERDRQEEAARQADEQAES